jgi:hypothetical protein
MWPQKGDNNNDDGKVAERGCQGGRNVAQTVFLDAEALASGIALLDGRYECSTAFERT